MNVLVPFLDGVPDMMPESGPSDRPAGKEPDVIDHVYGVEPPDAVRVAEYLVFCAPPGKDTVLIVGGLGGGGGGGGGGIVAPPDN